MRVPRSMKDTDQAIDVELDHDDTDDALLLEEPKEENYKKAVPKQKECIASDEVKMPTRSASLNR